MDNNIAEEPQTDVQHTDDVDQPSVDSYMELFGEVDELMNKSTKLSNMISHQPHDQARVNNLCEFVNVQEQYNRKVYDLLVEMNNFFGSE